MSSLLHKLGLSDQIGFHDVFSIDDAELMAFVPRPVYALLLVFPVSDTYEKFRTDEDKNKDEYKGSGPEEEVVWYKQTIGNACGLIGLLHAASNGDAKDFIRKVDSCFEPSLDLLWTEPTTDLSRLLQQAIPLQPMDRASLLHDSDALESAHQTAAAGGDSAAPQAEESVDLHYVCFVKSKNSHLWELDGRRKGPLDRGQLSEDQDILSDKALEMGVRSFLRREEEAGGGELRFSLIALAPSLDI